MKRDIDFYIIKYKCTGSNLAIEIHLNSLKDYNRQLESFAEKKVLEGHNYDNA